MTALQWLAEPLNEGGVSERPFTVTRESGDIPGILWTPMEADRPLPLVLIGHGGSGHKRADRQLMLARRLATVSQMAVVTIDGPFHGDRVSEPLGRSGYQAMLAAAGVDKVVDGMVDDWRVTLDAISALDSINADRIAYMGFSMGTRFGLPYVAVAGDRLRCAVLGKNGMQQTANMPAGVDMAPRFAQDAPKIQIPLLFHAQWDDELFQRNGQFELFDRLGTSDKRLIAFPGLHSISTPEAVQAWCTFIEQHLVG
jgi:dienelactone hydrolase